LATGCCGILGGVTFGWGFVAWGADGAVSVTGSASGVLLKDYSAYRMISPYSASSSGSVFT